MGMIPSGKESDLKGEESWCDIQRKPEILCPGLSHSLEGIPRASSAAKFCFIITIILVYSLIT